MWTIKFCVSRAFQRYVKLQNLTYISEIMAVQKFAQIQLTVCQEFELSERGFERSSAGRSKPKIREAKSSNSRKGGSNVQV